MISFIVKDNKYEEMHRNYMDNDSKAMERLMNLDYG